jgi:cobalt-zinc-cadmium efflux system membrane fusion protein
MKFRSLYAFLLPTAVCAAGLAGGCSPGAKQVAEPAALATNVTLTAAQRQNIHLETMAPVPFRRVIETTGTVGFDNDQATTVLAPFSGPASQLLGVLGAQVRLGDPLAVIDSPDFAAAMSAYRKGIATAQNTRKVADLDVELFNAGALSRRDMEQAQTDAVNAEADRDAARQQLHSLGVDDTAIGEIQKHLAVTNLVGTIRSPLAGTVVERLITPGQLLQAGTTPCFTVADLSRMWVMANIFESDASSVALGDPAEIITGASSNVVSGAVDNISAILDPNTRAIGVRVVADNPGGLLKKQMYVRVLIHSTRNNSGLLAPVSAVLRDDDNLPFVYTALAQGRFARRRVSLGSRLDDRYEITAGLKAGDQIVVDGALFLQFLQSQ